MPGEGDGPAARLNDAAWWLLQRQRQRAEAAFAQPSTRSRWYAGGGEPARWRGGAEGSRWPADWLAALLSCCC
jgi:hypothetical protein